MQCPPSWTNPAQQSSSPTLRGWTRLYTAMKNNKVKAIVAFEPGSGFVFPEKELPAPMPSAFDTLKGEPVPIEQFMALTKIPILIIYGDNIPDQPVAMPAQDSWRVRLAMAREWRDVVNKHGGDVTVTHLPEVGIKGNTHFPFSDLNNVQLADLVSKFLKEKNCSSGIDPSDQSTESLDTRTR